MSRQALAIRGYPLKMGNGRRSESASLLHIVGKRPKARLKLEVPSFQDSIP